MIFTQHSYSIDVEILFFIFLNIHVNYPPAWDIGLNRGWVCEGVGGVDVKVQVGTEKIAK